MHQDGHYQFNQRVLQLFSGWWSSLRNYVVGKATTTTTTADGQRRNAGTGQISPGTGIQAARRHAAWGSTQSDEGGFSLEGWPITFDNIPELPSCDSASSSRLTASLNEKPGYPASSQSWASGRPRHFAQQADRGEAGDKATLHTQQHCKRAANRARRATLKGGCSDAVDSGFQCSSLVDYSRASRNCAKPTVETAAKFTEKISRATQTDKAADFSQGGSSLRKSQSAELPLDRRDAATCNWQQRRPTSTTEVRDAIAHKFGRNIGLATVRPAGLCSCGDTSASDGKRRSNVPQPGRVFSESEKPIIFAPLSTSANERLPTTYTSSSENLSRNCRDQVDLDAAARAPFESRHGMLNTLSMSQLSTFPSTESLVRTKKDACRRIGCAHQRENGTVHDETMELLSFFESSQKPNDALASHAALERVSASCLYVTASSTLKYSGAYDSSPEQLDALRPSRKALGPKQFLPRLSRSSQSTLTIVKTCSRSGGSSASSSSSSSGSDSLVRLNNISPSKEDRLLSTELSVSFYTASENTVRGQCFVPVQAGTLPDMISPIGRSTS